MKHQLAMVVPFGILLFAAGRLPLAAEAWSAEVGWGGVVVPGQWAPLRVEATGMTDRWSLTLEDGTTLDFPGPGLYERPVFISDARESLHLRRFDAGLLREEQALPLAARAFPGHVVLVSGVDAATQGQLSRLLWPEEPIRVASLSPTRWPVSFLSWGGISAAMVTDPGPVLSPAQVEAARAWLASGGRLAVVQRRRPSMVDQLGPVVGGGRVVTDPRQWNLVAYDQWSRPGTDFSPEWSAPVAHPGPRNGVALGFVAAWGGAAFLLSRRKKKTVGPTLTVCAVGMLGLVALAGTGNLPWDRGVAVHSRQVVLPGDAGAVTSVVAQVSSVRDPLTGWPTASPRALSLWKTGGSAAGFTKTSASDRLVLESFGPAPHRVSALQVRWGGRAVQWSRAGERLEAPPGEWAADAAWVTRVVAMSPGWVWSVGLESADEGTLAWMAPAPGGAAP